MSNSQALRFAKLKLVGFAKHYWQSIRINLKCIGEEPITFQAAIKQKLKERYIPPY